MIFRRLLFIFFLVATLTSVSFAYTNISSCVDITSPGEYRLNTSLYGNQSNGICLDIQSSDVILDCQGYEIVGNWSLSSGNQFDTVGIHSGSSLDNVTIKNCYITNYSTGFYNTVGISNLKILNNTFYHNYYRGAWITASYNLTVDSNKFANITSDISDIVYIRYAKSDSKFINNEISENPGQTEKGVYFYVDSDITIENNTFTKVGQGIVLYKSSRYNIVGNRFYNLNWRPILSYYNTENSIISNNYMIDDGTNTEYGITLFGESNVIIENNYIEKMRYTGMVFSGGCSNITIRNNIINKTQVYQGINLKDSHDFKVYGNTLINIGAYVSWSYIGAFVLGGSYNNDIFNNTIVWDENSPFHNRKYGFRFSGNILDHDNNIYDNYIEGSDTAFRVENAVNNTFENNKIVNSTEYGFFLSNANNSMIRGNNVTGSDLAGINITDSSSNYNLIYNNYFSNNNINAYDAGNNYWNTTKTAGTNIIGGPYIGGNYWDDYTGTDSNHDGIGDIPYSNVSDYLPLVKYVPLSKPKPVVQPVYTGTIHWVSEPIKKENKTENITENTNKTEEDTNKSIESVEEVNKSSSETNNTEEKSESPSGYAVKNTQPGFFESLIKFILSIFGFS